MFGSGRWRYDGGMVGTFSEWMLGLPVLLQLLVAFAVISAIGATPLLMWLALAFVSTPDTGPGSRDRGRPSSS